MFGFKRKKNTAGMENASANMSTKDTNTAGSNDINSCGGKNRSNSTSNDTKSSDITSGSRSTKSCSNSTKSCTKGSASNSTKSFSSRAHKN